MNDIADKTGEKQYRGAPEGFKANEIRVDGETGQFTYINLKDKKEGEKAETKELGNAIQLVFLKIRRVLAYYDSEKEQFVSTNEHNSPSDFVYLFKKNKQGTAREIREEFDKLRTRQVVYALYASKVHEPEVVRLQVKGASLGSKNKADTTTDFYSYLQSFEGDDHVHQFMTELGSVEEKGVRKYFCIDFKRGSRLPKDKLEIVEGKVNEVHAVTSKQDEYWDSKAPVEATKEELETIEYPDADDADIRPEDIPF